MRWLQTQNRIEEMAKILTKVANSNGKTLPNSIKDALVTNGTANNNASKMVNSINSTLAIDNIFVSSGRLN